MMEIEPPNYKKLFFVSLMAVLLLASLFVGVFAPSAEGQTAIHVGTETELKTAISNASNGVPVDIILDKEIGLTEGTLIISANKDITLRSNGNAEFELFGASGAYTITIENQGVLTLAGITVTHVSGTSGAGVSVGSGGKLTMISGKISSNSGYGVGNQGNFTLSGGTISNNNAGVVISSISFDSISNFTMTGGEIANNTYGVGLNDRISNFNMTNGKIAGNTDYGVYNYVGSFTMSGGEISNNGRGVINIGTFIMTNGKIFSNTISNSYSSIGIYNAGGGGVYNSGAFTMSGGEISNNEATIYNNNNGGGVFTSGTFTMAGGEISKNTATNGGGVFVSNGVFNLYGGRISGNTATRNGGGCWVTDTVTNFNRLVVRDGVVFSDNRALAAYNRDSSHDAIYRAYIGDNVKWSEPFTQGYNNFDISYVFGTSITAFTVTVNDGYGTPTGAGSYSVGQTVTLNAGTRAGYNFARWTVNEGSVTLSSATSATATFTMPTNNVVINASWTVIQYNIRYTLNSGSNAAGNPTTYNAGNSFPIAIGNPTRTNYEFRGWNVTFANSTQTTFQISYRIPAGTIGDITLEANWATPSTSNSGGGGGSGGSSGGGSSGSGGGSGGNNNGNSGNSNNNTPYNGDNNPSGTNDNEQHTTDNEFSFVSTPVGIVLVISMLIISVGFILIVVDSVRTDNHKNKGIDPNNIKQLPGYWTWRFGMMLTGGVYAHHYYAKYIGKLNVMSRCAFGDEAIITRSRLATAVGIRTALIFVPFTTVILSFTVLTELGFTTVITYLDSVVPGATGFVLIFGWFAIFIPVCVIALWRSIATGNSTKAQINKLIERYAPDLDEYGANSLYCMLKEYNRYGNIFADRKPKLGHELLEILIECHNRACKFEDTVWSMPF
jgi:uncharacterized repeat protein (TIGR02543 family)